jgi:uncharacterized protein YggE
MTFCTAINKPKRIPICLDCKNFEYKINYINHLHPNFLMKRLYFGLLLSSLCFYADALLAQVAGNAIQSQQKSQRYYENNDRLNAKSPTTVWAGSIGTTADFVSDTAVTLNARVMMNVTADSYVAMLGTAQIAENVEECHTLIDRRIDAFLAALDRLGIGTKDRYVDFVSQVPVFEYEVEKKLFSKTYNEVPRGFEIKKNVHIAYTDNATLKAILTEAAKHEIYDIIKVDVVINDLEAVYDSLRHTAVRLLGKKADNYRLLGVKLSPNRYQSVAEHIGSVYPVEQYDKYTAFSNPTLSAVKRVDLSNVVSAPKSQTVYYNKLPYNEFDKVINPQIIEPAVQIYCHVQTRYILKP